MEGIGDRKRDGRLFPLFFEEGREKGINYIFP